MVSYDSDSSGGEGDDYTETNVLLGYASKKASEDTISYLGGTPTWIDPATPPSAALAKCKICYDHMALLLQLNGDLPGYFPGHERRIYVWTCRRKTCRRKDGSVRAVRGTRVTEVLPRKDTSKPKVEPESAKPAANLGSMIFGGPSIGAPGNQSSTGLNANPFSSSSMQASNPFSAKSNTGAAANTCVTTGLPNSEPVAQPPQKSSSPAAGLHKNFADALQLNHDQPEARFPPPSEPWPAENAQPPAYPQYFLGDADYEVLDKEENLPIPQQMMEVDNSGEGDASGGKEDKDVYESTIDKTFQKFADRVGQNPEQVIRYEFKGTPLLYSKADAVGKLLAGGKDGGKVSTASVNGSRIPRCTNCDAGRVFEVQLTPHAIMELESEERSFDGMDWGTIIVGVCEKDCTQKGVENGLGYVEEWAGVQWEEIGPRR